MAMRYGMDGEKYLAIPYEQIATLVSNNVICERIEQEVRQALETDPDLRILIHEAVREAMSKINFVDIVAAAAKAVIEQTYFPSQTTQEAGNGGKQTAVSRKQQ